MNQRLMLYRKVAAARSDEEIDRVARRGGRSVRPAAGFGARTLRTTVESASWPTGSASRRSTARAAPSS